MTASPLVSVVLPTRNRASSLSRAVNSVLSQTYPEIEVLVVDDGSTDHTARVLDEFGDRIRRLEQEPCGAYAARNLALAHARGELVAFIDSDDAWRPDKLAQQIPLFGRPAVGLVFGNAQIDYRDGPRGRRPRTSFEVSRPHRGRVIDKLPEANFIATTTVVVRRRYLEEIGAFPTTHELSADYLTWFRIASRHELDYVPQVVADYTVHTGGLSYDLVAALRARLELFSTELTSEPDEVVRAALRRTVVNLGVLLLIAAARRKPGGDGALRPAWRAVRTVPALQALAWGSTLIMARARVRGR